MMRQARTSTKVKVLKADLLATPNFIAVMCPTEIKVQNYDRAAGVFRLCIWLLMIAQATMMGELLVYINILTPLAIG